MRITIVFPAAASGEGEGSEREEKEEEEEEEAGCHGELGEGRIQG